MNKYRMLKEKHQKEVNEFPIGFAFSNKQFKEQMEKLGLTENDTDKVISIGGGGFIKKADVPAFKKLMKKIENETANEIKKDKTGEGFIFDMFHYELENHEYIITYDISETLDALNITEEDLKNNKALRNGLILAIAKIKKDYEEQEECEL